MIRNFSELKKQDIEIAGGKGANLGEMVNAGIPVPDGFVLTGDAYAAFLRENELEDWILEQLLQASDDGKKLMQTAKKIQHKIMESKLPENVCRDLLAGYHAMGSQRVAVRSSATTEDLDEASFAGQQETYLNVKGDEEVLQKVKACYASLWGERAVAYRFFQGYDNHQVALAVVIQQMIESDVAGVLFTVNPSNQKPEEIQINASYGLGESVVSGKVTPEGYTFIGQ